MKELEISGEDAYRMTINVFSDGMDHNIRAVIQRILDVWAEERIINHHHNAVSMCHRGNFTNVNQRQCRVAGAFDPDELGLIGPNEFGHVDLDTWRECHLDAMGSGNFGKVTMGTTVDIGDRDHVRALGKRLEDQSCSSGPG